MEIDESLRRLKDINMMLSSIYFRIYHRITQGSNPRAWYDLCGEKQRLASELGSCVGKGIAKDSSISGKAVTYIQTNVKDALNSLPEKLNLEEALRITYNLESSIINSIFFRLLYKIQGVIPNDINFLIDISLPEHISRIMNMIIMKSKNKQLVEKARKEKEIWEINEK